MRRRGIRPPILRCCAALIYFAALISCAAWGAGADPQDTAATPAAAPLATAQVDRVVAEWLAAADAPSVSIAIVQQGRLVYAKAYGNARLQPAAAATPRSRYAIDSLTKGFTAAALLLLVDEGRLTLDDPVSRWYPDLQQAGKVTVRQLLNHTSGIRDFWPQDFVTPEMTHATTQAALIDEWVRRPLDFEPGAEWQYSNTGYVLAGALVEKLAGQPLSEFRQRRIFAPLAMTAVSDALRMTPGRDALGYTRYGWGRLRPAAREQAGWLTGAADLAMTPTDVARWDMSLLAHSLLRAESYAAQVTPVRLNDGRGVAYGLGLDVEQTANGVRIGHSGSGSGFLAENRVWPERQTAIVVLTNNDWSPPSVLLERLAFLALPLPAPARRARAVFEALRDGRLPAATFTATGRYYFTPAALADLKSSLRSSGPLRLLELDYEEKRGGMLARRWKITCAHARLYALERGYPDGRLEEFLVTRAEP